MRCEQFAENSSADVGTVADLPRSGRSVQLAGMLVVILLLANFRRMRIEVTASIGVRLR